MHLSLPLAGATKPDCVVELGSNEFCLKQGGVVLELPYEAVSVLVGWLVAAEYQAVAWVAGEIEEPDFGEPLRLANGLTASVRPEATRMAFAAQLQADSGKTVAIDLDAIWALRVFVAEALRQEQCGVYAECV